MVLDGQACLWAIARTGQGRAGAARGAGAVRAAAKGGEAVIRPATTTQWPTPAATRSGTRRVAMQQTTVSPPRIVCYVVRLLNHQVLEVLAASPTEVSVRHFVRPDTTPSKPRCCRTRPSPPWGCDGACGFPSGFFWPVGNRDLRISPCAS